ncbi:MAG: hypothetical protein ACLQDL_02075 [Spirochaetia bacterium]
MGRLRTSNAEAGSILLDVLVGVFIVMVGYPAILGGMSAALSLAMRQDARVERMIEQRNEDAKNHQVLFQKE